MSVRSLLENAPLGTPPNSRNTSFRDNQAAEAPGTPLPDLGTPSVNGSAVAIPDAEVVSPSARLNSVRPEDDANNDDDEGVRTALSAEAPMLLPASFPTHPVYYPASAFFQVDTAAAGVQPYFNGSRFVEASQLLLARFTRHPVYNPASALIRADTTAAGVHLYFNGPRTHANGDYEAILAAVRDAFLNAALIDFSCVAGQGKGKGRDPKFCDTEPTENGNTEKDVAEISNAADILLRLRHIGDELNVVSELLGTSPPKCKVCTVERLCTDCLQVPWRQRAHPVSPPTVVEDESEHLYSSESEDEGPLLSAARKIGFSTSCHGNHLQHSAHDGNAVFDLLSLSSQGDQRFGLRHQNRGLDDDGEAKCRRCGLVRDPARVRYVEGYRKLGYERFEREDTVSVDDDAMGSQQHGRHGAAESDGEISSRPPKLSQKTIERLERERRAWRPESNTSIATSSDSSMTVTGVVEPIRLPLYAEESTTRASANASAVTDPEATAEPNASTSPPSSSRRLSYRDQRTGVSYPMASDFVDLTTTSSSPPPSTRQTRPKKAKPSPLKQVEAAVETHPAPTGRGGRVSKRHSSTQSRRGTRISARAHAHRAELTNEWVRMGLPDPTPSENRTGDVAAAEAGTGPWTPKKRTRNAPLTPPTTGRKRKAAIQAVEVEEPSPSQQKTRMGKAVPTSAQAGDDGRGSVDGEGQSVEREVEEGRGKMERKGKGRASAKHR
ncbi:MAG: hypothetical protein ALECFALPRED_010804 [Alectoria fallacina]|uniref:Uncharacterized protein n=1 Tax=Alectoria fallacina TaxID=1903189 RepID=A0A8H3F212_9LECA|nr:MAG: hypothetical protein ALECFALPRED_010804 [Alectoria fallacina]